MNFHAKPCFSARFNKDFKTIKLLNVNRRRTGKLISSQCIGNAFWFEFSGFCKKVGESMIVWSLN